MGTFRLGVGDAILLKQAFKPFIRGENYKSTWPMSDGLQDIQNKEDWYWRNGV